MTVRHLDAIAIVRDPNKCGGDPTLAGTRITVHDIVGYARLYGGDLELVREEALPDLSLVQLRGVMEWYEEHRQEIDAILHERSKDYARGSASADAPG